MSFSSDNTKDFITVHTNILLAFLYTGCNFKFLPCESINYGKTIVAVVIKLIHKMHRDVNGIA